MQVLRGGGKWGNGTGEAIALILQGIGVPHGLWEDPREV